MKAKQKITNIINKLFVDVNGFPQGSVTRLTRIDEAAVKIEKIIYKKGVAE